MNFTLPAERIIETDILATSFNRKTLGPSMSRRIVVLACGHRVITRATSRTSCPRCTEMMRRSLSDGSEDYVGFRHGDVVDRMEWPEDPCVVFNEPRRG